MRVCLFTGYWWEIFTFFKLDDDPNSLMVAVSKDWQLRDRIESLLAGESVAPWLERLPNGGGKHPPTARGSSCFLQFDPKNDRMRGWQV